MEIQKIKIPLPMPINSFAMSIGIDPGSVNMGIAIIEGNLDKPYAILYQIKMERNADPIERIKLAQEVMNSCIWWFSMPMLVTIEGSAFSERYRQTELAEIRASIALWCIQKGFQTKIVPPLTIRKKVFGSAKILPTEAWQDLSKTPDAAQALACAYYPLV